MAEDAPKLSGSQRAAILLMSLGEEDAATVLKLMDPKEVEKVGTAMAGLRDISRTAVGDVMEHFAVAVEEQMPIGIGIEEYIQKMLTKALGGKKAAGLIDRILRRDRCQGLEALQWMETRAIADMVRGEHPQIIAIVLAHLDAEQAAEILQDFEPERRNEVMQRVARLGDIQESALAELDELMSQRSDAQSASRSASLGGLKLAAEIMNAMDKSAEETVMEYLRESDQELSQQIEELMFSFEMLLAIDDRGIQSLLREITNNVLIIALKGADPELQEKIFKNMSKRAAEMLRDDIQSKGPVRLSEVEEAQKEIVDVVRRMADDGSLVIGSKGDEYV